MDAQWEVVVLATAVLGLVLGVVAGLALAARRAARSAPEDGAGVPAPTDGVEPLSATVGEVLDLLRAGAAVTDADARVLLCNEPLRGLGLVRDDHLALPALDRMVRDAAREGVVHEADLQVPRSAFGQATASLRVRTARLGSDRVLLVAEDRTETLRAEEIRRDFVVNVSHELKTPVGALQLLAETVGDAADDPDAVRRFAASMQREAHRLSTLVQDIIELSRLQDGQGADDAEEVAVPDVVREAVDRAGVTAEGRGVGIDVGPVPAVSVLGDHDMLVTAVRNLLDNAIGYSDPGTRVGVGTTWRPRRGVVEIAVVDQGIGIPPEALPRLFERFYRVDPARSRDTGGTGLGLSIVKHVAADHGGDVTVWSQPGQGSTFTLRLPVVPDARPDAPAPDDAQRDPGPGRFTARRRPLGPRPTEGAAR